MPDSSMALPMLDHEQESSPSAQSPMSARRSFCSSSPRKEKDTYGRTVMPSPRDPGNGPLQPMHLAASSGDVEKLKALLQSEDASTAIEGQAKFGWSPLIAAARVQLTQRHHSLLTHQ